MDANKKLAGIRDDEWSETFGAVITEINRHSGNFELKIDLSAITWIDPLPMLGILIAAQRASTSFVGIHLQLGASSYEDTQRGSILGFLDGSGFIKQFLSLSNWRCTLDGQDFAENSKTKLLEKLQGERHNVILKNSTCIPVTVFSGSTSGMAMSEQELETSVSKLLEDARNNVLKPFFNEEPELIDHALYKIRALLTELILNGYEHAYRGEQQNVAYFALFARFRQPTDSVTKLGRMNVVRLENNHSPTLARFARHAGDVWLEIFCHDHGRGLLADFDEWKRDDGFDKLVPKPSQSLPGLAKHLFRANLSRSTSRERSQMQRTKRTGLANMGLILGLDGDFSRLYTGNAWIGASHPWTEGESGGLVDSSKRYDSDGRIPAPGTSLHFCVPLLAPDTSPLKPSERLAPQDVEGAGKVTHEIYKKYDFFDERDIGNGIRFNSWSKVDLKQRRNVWLPGVINKQVIYRWLSAIVRQESVDRITWIVGDVPKAQLHLLVTILEEERQILGNAKAELLRIYVLGENGKCLFFSKSESAGLDTRSTRDQQSLRKVFGRAYALIKHHDSLLFWKGDPVNISLSD